jgi:diguanylate cyclase (GGDEF)-like protein
MAKILVVDDNPDIIDALKRLFLFYEFDVISAENGKEALDLAKSEQPDIILLDALMPVMDGFEACKQLKKHRLTKSIPVVFLTAKYITAMDRVTGLQLGADDYLLKPFNSKEMINRIKTILKKNQMIKTLKEKNQELTLSNIQISRKLHSKVKQQEPRESTVTDSLTGLYNRTFFLERLREEFTKSLRYDTSLSLILLDIDAFNRFNDGLGYQVGDYLLMKVANIILTNTKLTHFVARFDEEMYAVILPQSDLQSGHFEAEHLRVAINQTELLDDEMLTLLKVNRRQRNEYKYLTVSAGVATYPTPCCCKTEKQFFSLAKQALEQAKSEGKNKTVSISKSE